MALDSRSFGIIYPRCYNAALTRDAPLATGNWRTTRRGLRYANRSTLRQAITPTTLSQPVKRYGTRSFWFLAIGHGRSALLTVSAVMVHLLPHLTRQSRLFTNVRKHVFYHSCLFAKWQGNS